MISTRYFEVNPGFLLWNLSDWLSLRFEKRTRNLAVPISYRVLIQQRNSLKTLNNTFLLRSIPTTAPVWVTQAKYELAYQPPFLIKLKFSNLVGVTVLDDGGHFLAFELPKVFAEDVLKAVGEFRKIAKKNVKTDL